MSFHRLRGKRSGEKILTYPQMEAKIDQLREKIEKNEAFNKIPKYYINLDRSKDRREALEKEIALYEVENIHRFKAIDGKDIKDIHQGEIDGVQYVNDYDKCNKYQLAVTLSHLECIRQAGEKGEFPFIVLEDDVRFTLMPHWKKNIDEIIAELPEDCDILSLTTRTREKCNNGIYRNYNKGSTCVAYLVTHNYFKKIINLIYKKNYYNITYHTISPIFDSDMMKYYFNLYYIFPVLFIFEGFQKFSTFSGTKNNIDDYNKFLL